MKKKDPETCLNTLFRVKEKRFSIEYWYFTKDYFIVLNENKTPENQITAYKKNSSAFKQHMEIVSGKKIDLEIAINQDSIKTLLRSPSRLIRLWARQERYI